MTAAAQLLVAIVRTRLPRGVDVDDLDDFLDRNRVALEAVIEQDLGPLLSRMQAANRPFAPYEDIPEVWAAAKRTAANIAAMTTASKLYAERRFPRAEERAVLAGYSGWGGLSIQAASGKFPPARHRAPRRRARGGGRRGVGVAPGRGRQVGALRHLGDALGGGKSRFRADRWRTDVERGGPAPRCGRRTGGALDL